MTASRLSTRFSVALSALALAALAGCADVGSGTPSADEEFPVVKSTDQNVIICQSIRQTMQKDKKAADEARAAGNAREVAAKTEAFNAGVMGAQTVPGCDVSDLTGPTATPSAASSAAPVASPS